MNFNVSRETRVLDGCSLTAVHQPDRVKLKMKVGI